MEDIQEGVVKGVDRVAEKKRDSVGVYHINTGH